MPLIRQRGIVFHQALACVVSYPTALIEWSIRSGCESSDGSKLWHPAPIMRALDHSSATSLTFRFNQQ